MTMRYALSGAVSVLLGVGLVWTLKTLTEALTAAHRAGIKRVRAAQARWNADYEASKRPVRVGGRY